MCDQPELKLNTTTISTKTKTNPKSFQEININAYQSATHQLLV